jgi:uncharacterized metal-binding protein
MKGEKDSNCAQCSVIHKACRFEDGKGPAGCPTVYKKDAIEKALEAYDRPEIKEFARQSSVQEGECYAERQIQPYTMHPTKPRLQEIMEFCERMGYKRLGLAFCGGLTNEAALLSEVLEKNGFQVVSVSCKCGAIPKEKIGVKDEEKIRIGAFEPMCNPIAQAEVLNDAHTDFNIMLGLCVGHDSLFLKHIDGYATVFAVKDRVTGHNPMAALYTVRSYNQRFLKLEFGSDEEVKSRLVAEK